MTKVYICIFYIFSPFFVMFFYIFFYTFFIVLFIVLYFFIFFCTIVYRCHKLTKSHVTNEISSPWYVWQLIRVFPKSKTHLSSCTICAARGGLEGRKGRDSSGTIFQPRRAHYGRLRTVTNANVALVSRPARSEILLHTRERSTIAITDVTGTTTYWPRLPW